MFKALMTLYKKVLLFIEKTALAVRFSECREDQIARTTKQRTVRRFVHLIHFLLAGSAVLI